MHLRREIRTARGVRVAALRDVTLAAAPGAVTGLLGPNGAGKTTLFRVLAGLLRPDAGSARVMGHDVVRCADRARRALGLLTEEPALPGRLTLAWHLTFHAALRGMPWGQAESRAQELLDETGLGGMGGRRCAELSRGQRLRVALARALAGRPPALLLDEPTSSLDIEEAAALRARVAALARGGCAVLLATHNPAEAEGLCDVVWVMRAGVVLAGGSPAQLRRMTGTATLERAYLSLQRATG